MKTIALIPIRSGSKQIKNKNIKPMWGHPLFYWAAKAAFGSKMIDEVFFSTDSEHYVDVIRGSFKDAKILMRGKKLSSDDACLDDVVVDFSKHIDFDRLVLIQVTNPMVTAYDLTNALKYMDEHGYNSIVSTVKLYRFVWPNWGPEMRTGAFPMNYDPFDRPNRQDGITPVHIENGSFYIADRVTIEKCQCRIGRRIGQFEMLPETIAEIDTEDDWFFVTKAMEKRICQKSQ